MACLQKEEPLEQESSKEHQVKESLDSSRKASVQIKQISISLTTNLKTLQYKQQARYKCSYIMHVFSEEVQFPNDVIF